MNRNRYVCCLAVLTLGGLGGCSSGPSTTESQKAVMDKIQGKTQVDMSEASATDEALNAGGPSVYILDGLNRYRLFFHTPYKVVPGKEYVVEGINAQKAIDAIGDPDQGRNGYPRRSSCEHIVRRAWPGLAFDVTDLNASALRARVKRYPARPVFLVTRITPVEAKEAGAGSAESKKVADAEEKEAPEISVPAEKQSALLVKGATVQTAPLWEPEGGTARCKVLINTEGKISELETGAQLCEIVPWAEFQYKPTVQRGKPVNVRTEVEVRFEPRKTAANTTKS